MACAPLKSSTACAPTSTPPTVSASLKTWNSPTPRTLTVLPGAAELLRSLPPERWTIVTSATRRLLLGRLAAAGLPVPPRLIAADDVSNGKPAPDPYLAGAKLLGFPPADCIVVEDAPAGITAGRAAGCRVLGLLGTHPLAELHDATWVAPSLASVHATVSAKTVALTFTPA